MIKEKRVEIGDVYLIKFKGNNNEQRGLRPAVIFQNNIGNRHSPNIIALPLTSKLKRLDMPTHILINAQDTDLKTDSMVLCENPQTLSKDKLGDFITHLPDKYMSKIAEANLIATGCAAYLNESSLLRIRDTAILMNRAATVR